MKTQFFLGIDVGTGSARAGVFGADGRMLGAGSHPIRLWRPAPDHAEQSSEDIWRACGTAVRAALTQAQLRPAAIRGIGFDATCSLVALDADDRPVSISDTGHAQQNVMVWLDHRAIEQASRINQTRHAVLRYVGGVISPEMQTPKLLWLKEHRPAAWKRTARFFDLADFLTYRATGDDTRSLCTTVCKWTYLGHKGTDGAGWDADYFTRIGLGDLVDEGFRRIGRRVRPQGEPVGSGLTPKAARELGLVAGTPVGVGIIDAHAGGLGLLGASLRGAEVTPLQLQRRLALIGGTSSCHLAVAPRPKYIRGIWGPYHSAMVPGLWLTEGGQSATGALIDHLIQSHPAAASLQTQGRREGRTIYQVLNARLELLAQNDRWAHPGELTRELHVQPDFHGNRSPRANPALRGMIAGLSLSATPDDLARQYLAAIQAIAYGTRHIVEAMNQRGYAIDSLFACGGGTKNPVFVREHAEATGCRIVLPREPEAVLLGSAVLGAVAARCYPNVFAAMKKMNRAGGVITPARGRIGRYHDAKYRVFHRLHHDWLAYLRMMQDA